ncbi:MAG: hypothetical protein U1F06_01270 [Steroidobacteraceae bacterium]
MPRAIIATAAGVVVAMVTAAGAGAAATAGAGAAANGAAAASAPRRAAALPGSTWASIARLPDWSGVWEPLLFGRDAKKFVPPSRPKLTPPYEAQYAAFEEKNRTTPGLNFVSDVANCVPAGLPGSMLQPYPLEFLYTPGRVTIAIETYSVVRRIFTDGRPLPADPDPTYQGSSVGRWEGDTLVVDTTGILADTSPLGGIRGHGAGLRITERMRLVEPDLLEITTTRTDPTVFVEPYTTQAYYRRHRDWQIMEYVCAQNNRDQLDEHGNPTFQLERKSGE